MFLEKLYEKRKHTDRKENTAGTCMAIIPVIGFLIFGLIPIVLGISMSFFDFQGKLWFEFSKPKGAMDTWKATSFVGFDNFKGIFTPSSSNIANGGWFLKTLLSTVVMYISTPTCIVLSLLIAFFLSKKIKCKTFFRTVYLLPFVCSSIAITVIWGKFFDANNGILNKILIQSFNASASKYQSYNWAKDHFYTVLFLVHVWGGCGFNIVLYSAALTNVNSSYYEAAQVDGANPFQIFFKITVPAISPTTFYLFITGTIGSLQAYAVPDMLAAFSGTPAGTVLGVKMDNKAMTVVGYIYNRLSAPNLGIASAIAIVLAVIIGIITIINFIGSKYWVSYD